MPRNSPLLFLVILAFFHASNAGAQSLFRSTESGGGVFEKLPFQVSTGLREGYDDNIQTTHDSPISSPFTQFDLGMRFVVGSARTNLSAILNGGFTYYNDSPSGDLDKQASLTIGIVHHWSRRLTVSLNNYITYQAQPSFDLLGVTNRRNGQYLYTNSALRAEYLWSRRFSTVTTYSLTTVTYEANSVGTSDDRIEQFLSNQFRLLLQPATSLVGEYRLGLFSYSNNSANDAFSQYLLAGLDHRFNPKFDVSFRAGAELRKLSNSGDSSTSPYFEGTANYAYRRYSSLQFFMRYGLEQAGLGASGKRTTFRTGLRVGYGLTPKLGVYASVFYQHNEFSGLTSYQEQVYDIDTGTRFVVNNHLSLDLSYTRTQVSSELVSSEYARNRVSVGVRYSF